MCSGEAGHIKESSSTCTSRWRVPADWLHKANRYHPSLFPNEGWRLRPTILVSTMESCLLLVLWDYSEPLSLAGTRQGGDRDKEKKTPDSMKDWETRSERVRKRHQKSRDRDRQTDKQKQSTRLIKIDQETYTERDRGRSWERQRLRLGERERGLTEKGLG